MSLRPSRVATRALLAQALSEEFIERCTNLGAEKLEPFGSTGRVMIVLDVKDGRTVKRHCRTLRPHSEEDDSPIERIDLQA